MFAVKSTGLYPVLLLSTRCIRRTLNTVGVLFTEFRIANQEAMHLDANETQEVQLDWCLLLGWMSDSMDESI